tara:strand:- start:157 stop:549 length:393 start_codon:yes stop_codon:yes gene_type:complete
MIASNLDQLLPWMSSKNKNIKYLTSSEKPITWVLKGKEPIPFWISGRNSTIAVRITSHPIATELCKIVDSPIVSTSANIGGKTPARNIYTLRKKFHNQVDYILSGKCDQIKGPTEIRLLKNNEIIRPTEE